MKNQPEYKIIESKRWIHIITKETASIYGALPYTSSTEKNFWKIEIVGYTAIDLKLNIVGMGRKPFKSLSEIESFFKSINKTYIIESGLK